MKKIYFLFISIALIAISCTKTEIIYPTIEPLLEPKREQWGLAINYTATWCGPCGSWGAPRIHELNNMGKVVTITNHASGDPMYNQALYSGMSADRPTGGGIPSFWIGNTKSSNVSTMTSFLAQIPIAGIDMKTNRVENEIHVAAQVKFFEQGTGDYFLSFYMLESGIDGSATAGAYRQNGTSDPNYKHDYVIRKSHTTQVYGEQVVTDPAKDHVINRKFSMTVDANWTQEVYIVAALWKYNPDGNPSNNIPHYEFINGFVAK